MRLYTLFFSIFVIITFSSCKNAGNDGGLSTGQKSEVDSLKNEVFRALETLNNFPTNEIQSKLREVEVYYDFFMKTNHEFEKAVYLNELDKMASTQRAFVKVLGALSGLQADARMALNQLDNLKKAYDKNQITEEEFELYLSDESHAIELFLFNYNRRVLKAIDYHNGLDTLLPALENLKVIAARSQP
jgi:hypothetical protein